MPSSGATAAQLLPLSGDDATAARRRYGARSGDGVVVGDLLVRHVPALASGELEIVAIARRPGVLTKVAVRRRLKLLGPAARPVPLVVGVGGEHVGAVRRELGGEPLNVVQWHAEPLPYIAAALGLSHSPSAFLQPLGRRAEVLLGEIDYPGARGRGAVNVLLAGALTGWRIRLKQIARSPSWRALEQARCERRAVAGQVVGKTPKGLRVQVYGLNALLPIGQLGGVRRATPRPLVEARMRERLGQELAVTVLRLDADQGTIIASERVPAGRQLRLPFAAT
jgi:transcription antitermination factor NusA-like protein